MVCSSAYVLIGIVCFFLVNGAFISRSFLVFTCSKVFMFFLVISPEGLNTREIVSVVFRPLFWDLCFIVSALSNMLRWYIATNLQLFVISNFSSHLKHLYCDSHIFLVLYSRIFLVFSSRCF